MGIEALLGPLAAVGRAALARGGAAAGVYALAALFAVLAAIAAMAAAGFGLAALWFAVLPHVGLAGAALILAGVLVAACLGLALLARGVVRRHRRQAGPGLEEEAVAAATQAFNDNKAAMLLAALVAGMNAGTAHGAARRG